MRKRFAAVLVLLSMVCVASVAMAALVAPHPFGVVAEAPPAAPAPTPAAPAPTPATAAKKKPLPSRAAARLAQAKAICKAQSTPGHACRPVPERKGQPRNLAGLACVCD